MKLDLLPANRGLWKKRGSLLLCCLLIMPVAVAQVPPSIDSLYHKLESTTDPVGKTDLFLGLADQMRDINIRLMPALLDSARRLSAQSHYPPGMAMANHLSGVERWLNGYYSEAEGYYRQAMAQFAALADSAMLATTYSYMGLCYHYHAAFDSALAYHHKSLAINEKLGSKNKIAHNLDNIALVHYRRANFPELIRYSTRALQVRSTIEGYSSRTNYYNFGGEVFRQRALEASIAYHQKVLMEERKKPTGNLGASLNNLGSVYYNAEMYDSAVYYLKAGAAEMLKTGIVNRYAGHLHELGEGLRENGNYRESESVFLQAMQIWDSVGNRHSISIVRGNLAELYFLMEKYEHGLLYLDRALQIAEAMAYNPFCIRLYLLRSRYLMKLGKKEEAFRVAEHALGLAEQIDVAEVILESYKLLAEMNSESGNYLQASEYTTRHSQLKDRLFNGESMLQIAQLQVEFETDKKNREIELLNAQNEAQRARLYQTELVVGAVSSVILLLVYFGIKRQKYVRKLAYQKDFIDRQRQELLVKNQEKDLLLGEIHHRVKNNLQIISSLLKLQSRQLVDEKAQSAVLEGRDRVKAMALIHQCLYQHDRFSSIRMDDYIAKLVDNLVYSHGYENNEIDIRLDLDELHLNVDTALPVGLVINELVSNCFKHAFDRYRKNILRIAFTERGSRLELVVGDNGPGLSAGLSISGSSSSFGLRLINSLVDELLGSIQIDTDRGTQVKISISKYELAEPPTS